MTLILTRKEREKQNRRQAMMDAALVVFAEKGYASATLDEVAHRAEFGKGTLYLYFPKGKEEILRAIIEQMFEVEYHETNKMFSQTKEAGLPFETMLHHYIEGSISYFEAQKDVFRMIVKEVNRMIASDDMEHVEFVMRQRARIVGLLIPFIQDAIQKGELNPEFEPHFLANMILGNVHGYMMYTTFMQQHQCYFSEEMTQLPLMTVSEAAEVLTNMLLRGIKSN